MLVGIQGVKVKRTKPSQGYGRIHTAKRYVFYFYKTTNRSRSKLFRNPLSTRNQCFEGVFRNPYAQIEFSVADWIRWWRTTVTRCISFLSLAVDTRNRSSFSVFETSKENSVCSKKSQFEMLPLSCFNFQQVCNTSKFFCFLGFRVLRDVWMSNLSTYPKTAPEFCLIFLSLQVLQGQLSFQGMLFLIYWPPDMEDAFGNWMRFFINVLIMKLAETGSQNTYNYHFTNVSQNYISTLVHLLILFSKSYSCCPFQLFLYL